MSTGSCPGILPFEFGPEIRQLVGTEVGQNLAIHLDDRRQVLTGEPDHFIMSGFIGDDIDSFVIHFAVVEPTHRFAAPATVWLDKQSHPFRFHNHTLLETARFFKWSLAGQLAGPNLGLVLDRPK